MNKDIVKAFLLVNECRDDPLPGWRYKLHAEVTKICPELRLSVQNVADRRNLIYRKGYLQKSEIYLIRREVGNTIYNAEIAMAEEQENQDNVVHVDENIAEKKYLENYEKYKDTDPLAYPG